MKPLAAHPDRPAFSPEDIRARAAELEGREPQDILRWAVDTFGEGLVLSSSFGADSAVLLHIAQCVRPGLPVIFLDTFYHFPETLEYKRSLQEQWGLNVLTACSSMPREEFLRRYPEHLYRKDPDLCCYLHKVIPMQEALRPWSVWVTGIRRQQSETRSRIPVIEKQNDGMIKLNPLAAWTRGQCDDYARRHGLPAHPLRGRGYRSIGCSPCSRPAEKDGDERSGRWPGMLKTECGLHLYHPRGEDPLAKPS